ncbi:MAG: glycogen synthase [Spirochaetaceae bacterium]
MADTQTRMNRVVLCTNEYPPTIYGGAGVHIDYLSRALSKLMQVDVRCFGEQDERSESLFAKGYHPWAELSAGGQPEHRGAFNALSTNLAMIQERMEADAIHCHTWYTYLAGLLARELWDIPLVVTAHSLEPLRPWKREQLGGAYRVSSWIEKQAMETADRVIAVSADTANDIERFYPAASGRIDIIHNGIDSNEYRPIQERTIPDSIGIDSDRPYVLFVGRITRQKGIIHLVDAIKYLDKNTQIVLVAGAPDTPEIAREMSEHVERAQQVHDSIFWIQEMLSVEEKVGLYSHAAVFCCPSVYEPFGIINLEAMACGAPVVSSSVGGIPEVVLNDKTGVLVDPDLVPGTFAPRDPDAYARRLAEGINELLRDTGRAHAYATAGRLRALEHFSWDHIAVETARLYHRL